MSTLEERFWGRVWRCQCRRPCRRHCWPWGQPERYKDALECWFGWYHGGLFSDRALSRPYAAHIFAYSLGHGGLLPLPTKAFAVCHACDYHCCCNYAHLSLGARADNDRDRRGKNWEYREMQTILLPDNRRISYLHPHKQSLEGKDPAHVPD